MLSCSLLDLNESCGSDIDLLIGLKFPAWMIAHRRKALWIVHQYRDAYDLWGHDLGALHRSPNGFLVREAIETADRAVLAEARCVFANSQNVARRLKRFCGYDAEPLYHPPPSAHLFHSEPAEDYIYFPGRLSPPKRQELVLQALAETRNPVQVWFSGAPEAQYHRQLEEIARRSGISERVRWLGQVSEEEKVSLYARTIAVACPPVDEDYGYVPLEAMLSGKPVITCTDSGGPLEFVRSNQTGLVCSPAPRDVAGALDLLWEDRNRAAALGSMGRDVYRSMNISWDNALRSLLA
jgi:glycosyltransferase involved in cell wall biosynthesis